MTCPSRRSGSRTTGRRGLTVAAIAVAVCCTLVACGDGQQAQTLEVVPDTPGVDGSVGQMVLADVYLDTTETVPAGGSVVLRAALSNDSSQPDRLLDVTTPAATSVELLNADGTVSPDGIAVPGRGSVDATTGPVRLLVTGLTEPLTPTDIVTVTFEFATAGRASLDDVPASSPR